VKRKKAKYPAQPMVQPQSPRRLCPACLVEILAILILAGGPFAMGKFFEFSQPDPFDGGAYAYSAWHVLQGAKLWQDEMISAQPATFLMNYLGVAMCGFSELGPKIIQTLLQLAALSLMFYTLRKCFGKTAAVISTAVASIYLSAPVIAKFGNVKEQFMIAFMVFAACFLMLTIKTRKEWLWAAVGASVLWPYYFKPTGLSVLAATGLFILLMFLFGQRSWTLFLNRLIFLSGGAIVGISPLLLFFHLKNTDLLGTFPILLIKLLIVITVIGYAAMGVVEANRRYRLIERLKTVHSIYWKTGIAAMLLMYIMGMIIVRLQPSAMNEDIRNYLYATMFFSLPQQAYWKLYVMVYQLWTSLGTNDFYVTGSRVLMGFSQQVPIVLRYYGVLKLPVALAVISILVGSLKFTLRIIKKNHTLESQDWMAVFLAVWWIFDMGMIWVSPRSYEQYYLPMCASSSMLGGYAVWRFMARFNPLQNIAGRILSPAALLVMIGMVFPIFAGLTYIPFSGASCKEVYGIPRDKGYIQSWKNTWTRLHGRIDLWEQLGGYIQTHSKPDDRIYVWGWYPGIYVKAQRFSSSPAAFEGNMHIWSPPWMKVELRVLLEAFAKYPPAFIVDSRKREFPWNVPPLELWPQTPKDSQGNQYGFLSTEPAQVRQFETAYSAFLAKQASPVEAQRFEAMKPFRDYVMQNYEVVRVFGPHVLFIRKAATGTK
jgi:hypothetical protein